MFVNVKKALKTFLYLWELEAPSYQQRAALNRERQYRDLLKHNMQQQLLKQQHKQRQHLQQATLNRH